jgi:hypothetical protein
MLTFILVILVVVVLVVLGVVVWYSVQSLRQATILCNPVPLSGLKDRLDRDVAVFGRPELTGGQLGPFGFPVLWYKVVEQEYRRSGKSGGWRTVGERERHYNFFLHFPDGGRAYVTGKPSEVHGAHTRTDGGGFLAFHGARRTIHKWLPVTEHLTVLGCLGLSKQGATLLPSKKLGLLFSTSLPGRAARWERIKGWGGIGLAGLVLAILIIVAVALSAT